jgi:hypothetical protein
MIKIKPIMVGFALVYLGISSANAQGFLNKIKQKASQAAEKVVDKAVDKKTDEVINGKNGGNNSNPSVSDDVNSSSSSRNRPSNKGGAGLVTTPPDIKENLASAETAFKAGSYGEARYSVQQAMLGVEMEIGLKLLKSLPETVGGLPKQAEQDQVTSSGWGWTGLTIKREYSKEDKQLTFTLANNSVMMSAVNLFLTNGGYGQTTGGQQNWKQTKVKGNRAVIEYDDSSGYKLSVPIGQSSLLILEGINFANEQEMMAAANQFDFDMIKKTLGEK